jgi:hypothetical protein
LKAHSQPKVTATHKLVLRESLKEQQGKTAYLHHESKMF